MIEMTNQGGKLVVAAKHQLADVGWPSSVYGFHKY